MVAYALAGSMTRDLLNEPLAKGAGGDPVYLKDIWPSDKEIQETINGVLTTEMFRERYAGVFTGPQAWRGLETAAGLTYDWNAGSTYVPPPAFLRRRRNRGGGRHRRRPALESSSAIR